MAIVLGVGVDGRLAMDALSDLLACGALVLMRWVLDDFERMRVCDGICELTTRADVDAANATTTRLSTKLFSHTKYYSVLDGTHGVRWSME